MRTISILTRARRWLRASTQRRSGSDTDPAGQHALPAWLITRYPARSFPVGEPVALQLLPCDATRVEIELTPQRPGAKPLQLEATTSSPKLPADLAPGEYRLRARALAAAQPNSDVSWTAWSRPLPLTIHTPELATAAQQQNIAAHRESLMLDRDRHGVAVLTDPWALPPAYPDSGEARWFRTAAYEGATWLVNEHRDYYQDPLAYYLECVESLKQRGFQFITWHDLLDGPRPERAVLLQFDVDGGPLSMQRLADELCKLDVRGSIMLHREAHDWYAYRVEDLDLARYSELERAGWAIGYHNNSIGNLQGQTRLGDYGPDVLEAAGERVRSDLTDLSKHFRIRTLTHHGGNVFNKYTPLAADLDVVCVDRALNPTLWKAIRSAFSDGGFQSRPRRLRQHVEGLGDGIHFLRNHPLKYANYVLPCDVPPLERQDAARAGLAIDAALRQRMEQERAKQQRWFEIRCQHRLGPRTSHASPHKPISHRFRNFEALQARVEMLRARRRPEFLRQYPWVLGDPRVFWWRMLDAFARDAAHVLNVGALPPDQKDELAQFLADAQVDDLDIDAAREPTWLRDVTEPQPDLAERFDATLLFGLPYVHSPSRAIASCAELTRPGGIGLFGFSADTHPQRGALWHPETRPVWRREAEPLPNPSLRGRLWSFAPDNLSELFEAWDEIQVEFFSHYWFVLCRKAPQ